MFEIQPRVVVIGATVQLTGQQLGEMRRALPAMKTLQEFVMDWDEDDGGEKVGILQAVQPVVDLLEELAGIQADGGQVFEPGYVARNRASDEAAGLLVVRRIRGRPEAVVQAGHHRVSELPAAMRRMGHELETGKTDVVAELREAEADETRDPFGGGWPEEALRSHDWLYHHHVTEDLSVADMGRMLGVSGSRVKTALRWAGIPYRSHRGQKKAVADAPNDAPDGE
jgi:hypothetical protein